MDAQEVLKEKCGETKKCSSLKDTLDACNERVSNKPTTAEICTQESVDFMHCVDHCVSYKFFLAKNVTFSITAGSQVTLQASQVDHLALSSRDYVVV